MASACTVIFIGYLISSAAAEQRVDEHGRPVDVYGHPCLPGGTLPPNGLPVSAQVGIGVGVATSAAIAGTVAGVEADEKLRNAAADGAKEAYNVVAQGTEKAFNNTKLGSELVKLGSEVKSGVKSLFNNVSMKPLFNTTNHPPEAETSLIGDVKIGDTQLPVASVAGFEVGREVVIDEGFFKEEVCRISSFGSIVLQDPLRYPHSANAIVKMLPKPETTVSPIATPALAPPQVAAAPAIAAAAAPPAAASAPPQVPSLRASAPMATSPKATMAASPIAASQMAASQTAALQATQHVAPLAPLSGGFGGAPQTTHMTTTEPSVRAARNGVGTAAPTTATPFDSSSGSSGGLSDSSNHGSLYQGDSSSSIKSSGSAASGSSGFYAKTWIWFLVVTLLLCCIAVAAGMTMQMKGAKKRSRSKRTVSRTPRDDESEMLEVVAKDPPMPAVPTESLPLIAPQLMLATPAFPDSTAMSYQPNLASVSGYSESSVLTSSSFPSAYASDSGSVAKARSEETIKQWGTSQGSSAQAYTPAPAPVYTEVGQTFPNTRLPPLPPGTVAPPGVMAGPAVTTVYAAQPQVQNVAQVPQRSAAQPGQPPRQVPIVAEVVPQIVPEVVSATAAPSRTGVGFGTVTDALFGQIDTNRDGMIDRTEFRQALRNNVVSAAGQY